MKFTIVTPSYNQVDFIEQTITSVLNQTHKEFEYIVVDGDSIDGSCVVINKYASQITKTIIEKDNGQTDAINKGFGYATGEIFAYINSDDYYFRNTLEIVAKYFEDNPDVDLVYGDCVFTDSNGQFIRYFSEISDYDKDRLLNFSDHIMQPATFWRRRVFEQFGPFNEDFHFGFDWAFWCELANQGCNIKRIPYILAANRVYDQTKTLSGSSVRLDELKRINNRYKTRLLSHAYYRYYLSDLEGRNNRTIVDYLLMPLMLLLSYGNVIHHFRKYNKKIIFGFLPNSKLVLKEASIKLPRLNYVSVKICLCAPESVRQSVTVQSGGKLVNKYDFVNGDLEINLPLQDDKKDVDINFVFENEYCQFRNVLSRMLFFYKPKKIAAEVTSVVMS